MGKANVAVVDVAVFRQSAVDDAWKTPGDPEEGATGSPGRDLAVAASAMIDFISALQHRQLAY